MLYCKTIYLCNTHIIYSFLIRGRIKQLIVERLFERGQLKLLLRKFEVSGLMTEDVQNKILDDLLQLEKEIQELEAIYKSL
jgi:hypothetical protein